MLRHFRWEHEALSGLSDRSFRPLLLTRPWPSQKSTRMLVFSIFGLQPDNHRTKQGRGNTQQNMGGKEAHTTKKRNTPPQKGGETKTLQSASSRRRPSRKSTTLQNCDGSQSKTDMKRCSTCSRCLMPPFAWELPHFHKKKQSRFEIITQIVAALLKKAVNWWIHAWSDKLKSHLLHHSSTRPTPANNNNQRKPNTTNKQQQTNQSTQTDNQPNKPRNQPPNPTTNDAPAQPTQPPQPPQPSGTFNFLTDRGRLRPLLWTRPCTSSQVRDICFFFQICGNSQGKGDTRHREKSEGTSPRPTRQEGTSDQTDGRNPPNKEGAPHRTKKDGTKNNNQPNKERRWNTNKGKNYHSTKQRKGVPPHHWSNEFLADGNTCTAALCDEMWVSQTDLPNWQWAYYSKLLLLRLSLLLGKATTSTATTDCYYYNLIILSILWILINILLTTYYLQLTTYYLLLTAHY